MAAVQSRVQLLAALVVAVVAQSTVPTISTNSNGDILLDAPVK